VSQAALLHMETALAVTLPTDRVPAVVASKPVVVLAVTSALTTVRTPAPVTFQPVELMAVVSRASPMVMVSASALVPSVIVSQAAELQKLVLVALVLPKVKAPAVVRSKLLACELPVVLIRPEPASTEATTSAPAAVTV